MQLEKFEQLIQSVNDAQMVLVGLGEEWIVTEEMIESDLEEKDVGLQQMFRMSRNVEKYQKVLPILMSYYYQNYIPTKIEKAYQNMRDLLEEKNYFVVSLSVDSYLRKTGFKEDRYVNPCGTYEKLQCENGCRTELVSADELLGEIESILVETNDRDCHDEKIIYLLEKCLNVLENYHCEQCGAPMSFNLLDTKKYCEEGYLEQWKKYMKWLQGTLNRELCVIESGVGVKHPSVIRWPFEKTVFYNQKAKMFRIHKMLYQVNEEVAERAYGCKCHSVDLFSERNVKA